jgi:hypothetical protein
MRSTHLILLLVIVLAAACQPAATGTPEARAPIVAPAASATSAPSNADWQTFTSTSGKFSLSLPAAPRQQELPVSTEVGTIEAIMYTTEVDGVAYAAGYSDFPGAVSTVDPQKVLAGSRDGAAQNVKGRVTQEKPIDINGHPGLEITIEIPASASVSGGATYHARLYLVGNRLYQIIHVAPKSAARAGDYRRLFYSFQLIDPPASVPAATAAGEKLAPWSEYRSDKGNFKVLLPDQPKEQISTQQTAAGEVKTTINMVEAGDVAVGVGYNDLPPDAVRDQDSTVLLENGRDGAVKNINGKLISDKLVALGAYPGLEFSAEVQQDYRYLARIYLIKDRLYQLVFLAPQDQIDDATVARFFDSFELLRP